jgi:hypothetical protein
MSYVLGCLARFVQYTISKEIALRLEPPIDRFKHCTKFAQSGDRFVAEEVIGRGLCGQLVGWLDVTALVERHAPRMPPAVKSA